MTPFECSERAPCENGTRDSLPPDADGESHGPRTRARARPRTQTYTRPRTEGRAH